jgi:hypothetical protein
MIKQNEIIRFFELKNLKYDEVKIKLWQEYLSQFEPEDVIEAMKIIVKKTEIFNPNVGHIEEEIAILKGEDDASLAESAWLEVLTSAKGGGEQGISDRARRALGSLGGMQWLRDSDPKSITWTKKAFIDEYMRVSQDKSVGYVTKQEAVKFISSIQGGQGLIGGLKDGK